jgi:hypothetical protein
VREEEKEEVADTDDDEPVKRDAYFVTDTLILAPFSTMNQFFRQDMAWREKSVVTLWR